MFGEASVKTADAKKVNASSRLSPGSILALDDDAIDIDMRSGTGSGGEYVHQEHGETHCSVNQIVGEVDAERNHGLDALDQEPDEQHREDELPDRARAEGPVGDEHAGHGHSHEDVRDVDVPTSGPATCD